MSVDAADTMSVDAADTMSVDAADTLSVDAADTLSVICTDTLSPSTLQNSSIGVFYKVVDNWLKVGQVFGVPGHGKYRYHVNRTV